MKSRLLIALAAAAAPHAARALQPSSRADTVETAVHLIPIEMAEHPVDALPDARLVVLHRCGHSSYLECPADVRRALTDFSGAAKR